MLYMLNPILTNNNYIMLKMFCFVHQEKDHNIQQSNLSYPVAEHFLNNTISEINLTKFRNFSIWHDFQRHFHQNHLLQHDSQHTQHVWFVHFLSYLLMTSTYLQKMYMAQPSILTSTRRIYNVVQIIDLWLDFIRSIIPCL